METEEKRALAVTVLRDPPSPDLLCQPLGYLFADHFRQRILCQVFDDFAAGNVVDSSLAEVVVHFLKNDFGLHILDEEKDLFPMLRLRARPEDKIETLLVQLSEEHAADGIDASDIVKVLSVHLENADDIMITDHSRDLLKRFAANERQHIILENAIILPLAEGLLGAQDLRQIGESMAARRNINYADLSPLPAGGGTINV
ncbi:MAG: hemerythrin domain-containing protein [Parvibaculaceae bacterium]|nr:hemerythrin domain-containing protein [Parvibaculaceae bacterium]